MIRTTPALMALAATLTLGLASCGGSSSDDAQGPSEDTVATPTSIPGGDCPASTEIEVAGESGPATFTAASAFADVTLDQSATILVTSYTVEPATAEGIYNPSSLATGQFGVTFYISATDGGTLETGTYVSSSDDPEADLVLNTSSAYDDGGRLIATGFDVPDSTVEVTSISDSQVCGTVTTPEFSGDFAATRI